MEKEPRQYRRGLDSETLTTLQATSLQYLTTTTSAHTAQEAMNLLILAVVRLERALQRVHPPTIRQGKHTRNYTGGNPGRQASAFLTCPNRALSQPMDDFVPSPGRIGDSPGCLASARRSRGFHLIRLSTYPLTAHPQLRFIWGHSYTVFPRHSRRLSRARRTFSPAKSRIVGSLAQDC
jgi:hypothetical protein